jgi:DNA-binding NarL/FixJ family response regulator
LGLAVTKGGFVAVAGQLPLRSVQESGSATVRRRAVRSTSVHPEEAFRVLLASGTPETTRTVGVRLEEYPGCEAYIADTEAAARTMCGEMQPEVLLIDLLVHGSEAIALGIELGKLSPNAQLVFLVEDDTDPELRVAKDMGITRFVEMKHVAAWLSSALQPLAMLARAQRDLQEAREAVDAIALWKTDTAPQEDTSTKIVRLAVGEGRYREAYLRAVLARTGGRREAARLAGVPYTTFCLMLRKFGISPSTPER